MTKASPPMGLRLGGLRLWNRVLADYEMAEHEEAVLLQACRIVDVLDRLQLQIDTHELVIESPQGSKVNPAVVEFRQQAVTLAKCMASLRIPLDDEQKIDRQAQQRVGVRKASLGGPR